MRKWLLISIFFFAVYSSVQAQKEANIWYFGQYAGIDFNYNPPKALTNSAMSQYEGCASISDAGGNLLFYTDGMNVWNKHHSIMQNGTGLMGDPSSTQSGVIVPKPENPNIYYVFTVDAEISDVGVRYSVIDLNLDNGNGAVTSEKNIFLVKPSEEKITAVKHANGTDIWVITHIWDSKDFLAYLVTKDGIQNPVISSVGSMHEGPDVHGSMKVSPDGKKLAIVVRNIQSFELFDFNSLTGVISDPITFQVFNGSLYGIGFSSDCSKIYVGKYANGSEIFQYDLNAGTNDDIVASRVLIGTVSNFHLGALQLAPDEKIYVSKHDNLYGDSYLGVINEPNKNGTNCNFVEDGFYLSGKKCIWGLPNFIQSIFVEIDFTWQPDCFGDTTLFTSYLTNVDSVSWDFGDPASGLNNFSGLLNPSHVFTAPGWFTVTLTAWTSGYPRSVSNDVLINKQADVNLGPDTNICSNLSFYLNAGGGYDSYLWQDGTTDSVFQVDTSGIYWVTVENECGTASDTIVVGFKESFEIDLGADTTFCYGNSILIFPGGNYVDYLWQDGSIDTVMVADNAGIYWVQVTDSAGCSATDSLTVETYPAFEFNLGNDTTICDGDYIFLNGPDGYESYQWQDGSGFTSLIAYTAGFYWLEVTDTNHCASRDSLLLTTNLVPDTILGPDTLFCNGGSITLQTNPEYEKYYWQDGSEEHTLVVDEPGKYWVMVFDSLGCSGIDTINLDYYSPLELRLQATGYLCEDDSVLLEAISNYDSFLWQDSSAAQNYIAKDSGTYWVRVSSQCETKSDTIVIDACSSIWVPNVFTPNNDGYNDYFYAIGKNIPKFKMEIFNRWGQTLKVLNSIDEKWDGTYKGRKEPQGTYFWVADYEQVKRDGSTEHVRFQGSVTLVR